LVNGVILTEGLLEISMDRMHDSYLRKGFYLFKYDYRIIHLQRVPAMKQKYKLM
jgi:hypothetical protein